ncbi:hypothetical protein F2P81_003004 [Scophthalmus maximus]|uniref:Uncharacterized protein n=1 Tax=Scophthalmus maximus TaxID=52904 RepID=A0A6A4T8G1_SCOMX|nr:hypothetical protein F2P81_003004 [Scophthalmus maximus]
MEAQFRCTMTSDTGTADGSGRPGAGRSRCFLEKRLLPARKYRFLFHIELHTEGEQRRGFQGQIVERRSEMYRTLWSQLVLKLRMVRILRTTYSMKRRTNVESWIF